MTSSQQAFSQRKVVSQFEKWNEQPAFSSCPIYKSYFGQINRKRNESALLVWATDRLSARTGAAGCSRSRDTPSYTALGDTVKKVVKFTAESITSLLNLVRSIQILLKLQTSEQTPLMWKPGETLFNKHITTIHHGFNIVRLQEQLVAEMVECLKLFLNASHNFSQHFKL